MSDEIVVDHDLTDVTIHVPAKTVLKVNGERIWYQAEGRYQIKLHLTMDLVDNAQHDAAISEAITALKKLRRRP